METSKTLVDVTENYKNTPGVVYLLAQQATIEPECEKEQVERNYIEISEFDGDLWLYANSWISEVDGVDPLEILENPTICFSVEKVKELISALQGWVDTHE